MPSTRMVLAVMGVVAVGTPALAAAKPKPLPSSAVVLPGSRSCTTTTMTVKVRKIARVTWTGATVRFGSRRVATLTRAALGRAIKLGGVPTGRFTVTVAVKARGGRTLTVKRTYPACAQVTPTPTPRVTPQPVRSTPTPTASPAPTASPSPTPTATPAPTGVLAGSYSGVSPQNTNFTLYVSADRTHVQDVYIPTSLACTPSGSANEHLGLPEIPIAADGTFNASTTQDGVFGGVAGHFAYAIAGRFDGTKVTGSYQQELVYNDGTAHICSSNLRAFTAGRDAQGDQAPVLPVGSYSGVSPQNTNFSFFVSTDGRHLQDVVIPTSLRCAPSSTLNDHLAIAEITLAADGSFTASATQTGVLYNAPATFTYTFSGHAHGLASTGVVRVAGTYREDVTANDGVARTCSTNAQSFSAGRDTQQGDQTPAAPQTGTYSGVSPQNTNFSFYISRDGRHVQDVIIPTALRCSPAGTANEHIGIADIPIAVDGSFSATTTQAGVFDGTSATFTYTFSGHLHGPDASGFRRVAGVYREDLTYGGTTCSSNDQSWFADRDPQNPAVPAPLLPAGSYAGVSPQNTNFSFYVAPDAQHLQDVIIPTALRCSPSSTLNDHIGIAELPLAADGSFSVTTTQTGILYNAPATFTYTFSGHAHGFGNNGELRVSGVYREDAEVNDGVARHCSSNEQSWAATRQAQGVPSAAPVDGSYSGVSPQNTNFSFVVSGAFVQSVSVPTAVRCSPSGTLNNTLVIGDIPIDGSGAFKRVSAVDGVVAGKAAKITYTFSGHFHGPTQAGIARVAGIYRTDITYTDGGPVTCSSNEQSWAAVRS